MIRPLLSRARALVESHADAAWDSDAQVIGAAIEANLRASAHLVRNHLLRCIALAEVVWLGKAQGPSALPRRELRR